MGQKKGLKSYCEYQILGKELTETTKKNIADNENEDDQTSEQFVFLM